MRNWFRNRRDAERDMADEIAHHISSRAADLEARGLSPQEALRQARIEFGAIEHYKEEGRQALGYRLIDELTADLRYAMRGIRNSRGFVYSSVAVLALAIAVNTAFFTLYGHYVLKPLPIRAPERNFDIVGVMKEGRRGNNWSAAEYRALQANTSFEGLYTEGTFQAQVADPIVGQAFVNAVSGNYFELLGGQAAIGRVLNAEDARSPVAVLSDAGWRRLYQADPNAVGRALRVRKTVFTVVGVAPASFIGTEGVTPDFWTPTHWRGAMRSDFEDPEGHGNVSGVLKQGIAPERAAAELSGIASGFARTGDRALRRVDLDLRDAIIAGNAEVKAIGFAVFLVFLLVLLIACANLANLHLARAAARSHEIGIRLSLGASRARLVRQLLTEAVLLGVAGAALGLIASQSGVNAMQRYLLSAVIHEGVSVAAVETDWRVFVFTAIVGICAGIAFGLLPALEATSPSLTASTKKDQSAFAGRVRPKRMRNALIVAQSVASVVLLILAGLLARNLQRLSGSDPGFEVDKIVNTRIERPTREIVERLRRDASVEAASVVAQVPLYGWTVPSRFQVDGRTEPLISNRVDEGFFDVLGLRFTRGRGFTRLEAEQNAGVAVISEATARLVWPGEGNVLGKRLQTVDPSGGPGRILEVIGVVPDVMSGLFFQGKDRSQVYTPMSAGDPAGGDLIVRSRLQLPSAQTAALRALDREIDAVTLRQVAAMQRFPFEAAAAIAMALGLLALVLTCLGLFGVVSFAVAQRTKELGIRLALGASPSRILWQVLAGSSKQVSLGIAIALPACYALSRLVQSNTLQIRTFDWAVYVGVPALMLLVATISCLAPARRAASVDPLVSLRDD